MHREAQRSRKKDDYGTYRASGEVRLGLIDGTVVDLDEDELMARLCTTQQLSRSQRWSQQPSLMLYYQARKQTMIKEASRARGWKSTPDQAMKRTATPTATAGWPKGLLLNIAPCGPVADACRVSALGCVRIFAPKYFG